MEMEEHLTLGAEGFIGNGNNGIYTGIVQYLNCGCYYVLYKHIHQNLESQILKIHKFYGIKIYFNKMCG